MDKIPYKYLEIKKFEAGKVIKRIDVSDKSDREIDKIDRGMNINLNHAEYYTFTYDSEMKLAEIN